MCARMNKVPTRAVKAEKPKLEKDPTVMRRSGASKKAVGSLPDPSITVSEVKISRAEIMQRDIGMATASVQNEMSGVEAAMQDRQDIQSVIYFDGGWYLEMYPDVREAGIDPLEHFLNHGSQEGRSPNALFDSQAYLRANPDVVHFERGPFIHYICFGFQEKRPLR